MQVILLEKINKLGNLGELVTVKPGFARNYLIPQGMAVFATKENLQEIEKRRSELEKKSAEILKAAQLRQEEIEKLVKIEITAKASEEGKLYGSIGPKEIATVLLDKHGVELSKKDIIMSDGVIRTIGEHIIKLRLHSDIIIDFTVDIIEAE